MKNQSIKYGINFTVKNNIKEFKNNIKNHLEKTPLNCIQITYNNQRKGYLKVTVENNTYICNNKKYNSLECLVKDNHIVPKLFCKGLTKIKYQEKLINLEHKKDDQKHKIFRKYDEIFRTNFNVNTGLNDIYEWYTGAVVFKDYEWYELKNTRLKELFEKKENGYYAYSMPTDNGLMLRSSKIYYYFSTDVSRFKKPTLKQIKKWFNNINEFLEETVKCVVNYKVKDDYDKRLLLGLLDNIRNIVLILTNCELMSLSKEGLDFIYHDTFRNSRIDEYFNLIDSYQSVVEDICFNKKYFSGNTNRIKVICQTILRINKETFKEISTIDNKFILSKCFNPLREIDNYFENYIICKDIIQNKEFNREEINLIGVLYGGLELPFILKRLRNKKTNISFIFQNHGMYLDRQNRDENTIDTDLIECGTVNKTISTYLVDDNMMSGLTMQFTYNKLIYNDFTNINGIIVMRHPNVNRIAQLEHFDIALNIDLVDKYIYGMITDTPYTKIKKGTNYNDMFVNELNIFSIMTEVFLKALYCNNSFIKDSQVDIFLGYSEGKND